MDTPGSNRSLQTSQASYACYTAAPSIDIKIGFHSMMTMIPIDRVDGHSLLIDGYHRSERRHIPMSVAYHLEVFNIKHGC